MKSRSVVLLAILSIACPAASLAQAAKPLIQLHLSVRNHGHGTQYADQDLFVASDGTATGQLVTGDPVTGTGWALNAKTARASASQLAALQTALGRASIGQQAGGCAIVSQVLADGTAELRWYGRNLRKNTLSLQIVSGDDEIDRCPPELQALLHAIENFSGSVLGQGVGP